MRSTGVPGHRWLMPMIDVYAATGTFTDEHQLAVDLASAVMKVDQVQTSRCSGRTPRRSSTAAAQCLANVDGDSAYAQVPVLRQRAPGPGQAAGGVSPLTAIVAEASRDPSLTDRTWSCSPSAGRRMGLAGHANTNSELVQLARAELAAGRAPAGN